MHRPPTPVQSVYRQSPQYRETNATNNHSQTNSDAYKPVSRKTHEVVGVQREASVVPGGDAVKDTVYD